MCLPFWYDLYLQQDKFKHHAKKISLSLSTYHGGAKRKP